VRTGTGALKRAAFLLVFAGCSPAYPALIERMPLANEIHVPAIGEQASAEIGAPILVNARGISHPFIPVKMDQIAFESYEVPEKGKGDEAVCAAWSDDLQALMCETMMAGGGSWTRAATQTGYMAVGDSVVATYYRFGDDIYRVTAVRPVFVEYGTSLQATPDGFRNELVYSGKDGTTIRLTYREYQGLLVRPDFDQDLVFDLSDSDVIGFRSARILVVEATNTSITYVVIEHL
jgi:hypothetical protein